MVDYRPRLRTLDGTEIPCTLDDVVDPAVVSPTPHHVERAVVSELSDRYFDPVWQFEVHLSELEHELLQHPFVRRLAQVAHAGAASVLSPQTYSRLDHSLGLFTIASALRPGDRVFRAAALVHDIGHTPLSHTVERALGMNHHHQGDALVHRLAPVFTRHGLRVEDVVDATHGIGPSGLGAPGAMRLDHFESFVRSAHAHGRLAQPPRQILDRIQEVDGQVSCDSATAGALVHLAVEEARRQRSCSNARANAVVGRLVQARTVGLSSAKLGDVSLMTDRQFWAFLAEDAEIAPSVELFLTHPESWTCTAVDDDKPVPAGWFVHRIDRLYFEPPLVGGRRRDHTESERALVARLPRRFLVSEEPSALRRRR